MGAPSLLKGGWGLHKEAKREECEIFYKNRRVGKKGGFIQKLGMTNFSDSFEYSGLETFVINNRCWNSNFRPSAGIKIQTFSRFLPLDPHGGLLIWSLFFPDHYPCSIMK